MDFQKETSDVQMQDESMLDSILIKDDSFLDIQKDPNFQFSLCFYGDFQEKQSPIPLTQQKPQEIQQSNRNFQKIFIQNQQDTDRIKKLDISKKSLFIITTQNNKLQNGQTTPKNKQLTPNSKTLTPIDKQNDLTNQKIILQQITPKYSNSNDISLSQTPNYKQSEIPKSQNQLFGKKFHQIAKNKFFINNQIICKSPSNRELQSSVQSIQRNQQISLQTDSVYDDIGIIQHQHNLDMNQNVQEDVLTFKQYLESSKQQFIKNDKENLILIKDNSLKQQNFHQNNFKIKNQQITPIKLEVKEMFMRTPMKIEQKQKSFQQLIENSTKKKATDLMHPRIIQQNKSSPKFKMLPHKFDFKFATPQNQEVKRLVQKQFKTSINENNQFSQQLKQNMPEIINPQKLLKSCSQNHIFVSEFTQYFDKQKKLVSQTDSQEQKETQFLVQQKSNQQNTQSKRIFRIPSKTKQKPSVQQFDTSQIQQLLKSLSKN